LISHYLITLLIESYWIYYRTIPAYARCAILQPPNTQESIECISTVLQVTHPSLNKAGWDFSIHPICYFCKSVNSALLIPKYTFAREYWYWRKHQEKVRCLPAPPGATRCSGELPQSEDIVFSPDKVSTHFFLPKKGHHPTINFVFKVAQPHLMDIRIPVLEEFDLNHCFTDPNAGMMSVTFHVLVAGTQRARNPAR
jgi:hypothetical protein